MNVNTYALFAALIGIVCGRYFVTKNLGFLTHAVYSLHLIIDKTYAMKLYTTFQSLDFYQASKSEYNYFPLAKHFDALNRSRQRVYPSIQKEYVIVAKTLLFEFFRLTILPTIFFVFTGQVIAFVGAMIITVATSVWFETILKHGASFTVYAQRTIILRHAYLRAGYAPETTTELAIHTLPSDAGLEGAESSTQEVQEVNSDSLTLLLSEVSSSEDGNQTEFKITWQRLWWGNDFVLCIVLIVMYWLTSAESSGAFFTGAIQLVVLVQLFFIPVWAVISVALKLLSRYH